MTFFLLSVFSASLVFAASQTDLRTAVQTTWDLSPEIRELNAQVTMADNDKWRRYIPNEPSLTYGRDESDHSRSYGLALSVGFPGKAFAYSKLDSAVARSKRRDREARKAELAALVIDAYVDCSSAQANLKIREAARSDAEAFFNSLKVRRGIVQTEKLSFELEVRQARRESLLARDAQESKCRRLAKLMNTETEKISTLPLPDDLDAGLVANLGANTAEENRILSTIDLADAHQSLAWWAQMPDLTFSYSQKRFDGAVEDTGGRWFPAYGVSVTLPLLFPFHESVEARRARSDAILERSKAQLDRLLLDSTILEAALNYQRSRAYLEELRKKDLPLGQALLESAFSAYRGGQLGYAEMVMSRKALIELQLKDVELRSQIVAARLKCLNRCEVRESL